jgi:hypothetical protein
MCLGFEGRLLLRDKGLARIAAGYVDCNAEFLSQADLRARSHERMSALSTAASRVPKSSVASPLASKRVIQWQIASAVVACLIFDVKAETLIDARERGLTEDNRFESSLRRCSWEVGAVNSSRKKSKCAIPSAISPSPNAFIIPDIRHI